MAFRNVVTVSALCVSIIGALAGYRSFQAFSQEVRVLKEFTTNTVKQTDVKDDYRLELVHIPKTGGTMLEVIAFQNNVTWGACHFEFPWKHRPKNVLERLPPHTSRQNRATKSFCPERLVTVALPFVDTATDEPFHRSLRQFEG